MIATGIPPTEEARELLRRALADPGWFVPRQHRADESMEEWQLRAVLAAFNPPPRRLVIAGNRREAEFHAREMDLGREGRHWHYIGSERALRGLRGPLEVLFVGSYVHRRDFADISIELREMARRGEIIERRI